MTDGVEDLRNYFYTVMKLIAAGTASTALVLVAAFLKIAPPWPDGAVQITAVAQLVVLIVVYQFSARMSRRSVDRNILTALVVLILGALAYLALFSLIVYEIPTDHSRGVKGFFCSPEGLMVYKDACPFLSDTMFAQATFNADQVWTPMGLLLSRLSLFTTWIAMFASLVVLFGSFVAFQRRRKVRPTPA